MKQNFNRFIIFCSIIILLISILFLGCPEQSSGGSSGGDDDGISETNIITIVDSEGNTGQYTSIAEDGSNIYISYYEATNGILKLTKSNDKGSTWNIYTVDIGGDVGLSGPQRFEPETNEMTRKNDVTTGTGTRDMIKALRERKFLG